MTIGVAGSSRGTSRNSRSTKFNNSSKLLNNQYGSSSAASGSQLGGQPLSGPAPGSSSGKCDIKHRFEITKKLGSGTYGKVSLAYDHKTEREVAVKLIKKSAIENKQDLVRIRREIRIMSALKHPNIIQIFEVFENKDKIILVMEYASGGELYDYVSTYGSLPEAEARRIFRQITSAVLYCHKHKVAHRDLKLENILLDGDNNAKIADFGLSNYFSDKSLLSTFCGSPLYASPEIINGTPYKGPEVDCWSLGILLYTLVYGSMPFDGRDFNRMVRQIKRGAYFEPDTPSTASMLIRNMLRVNPERRADIDAIASHWWLNLEENMPVIQELPENQIIDHTPLTERAETMVVQDLADETDVFMDFGHLSAHTRKKIEEFRRRRIEAEEYNESSPIKPPKTRKTEGTDSRKELSSNEKSLRHDSAPKKEDPRPTFEEIKSKFTDPLERLKQLENRLQNGTKENRVPDKAINALPATAPPNKEIPRFKPPNINDAQPQPTTTKASTRRPSYYSLPKRERYSPEQPEDPITSNSRVSQKAATAAETPTDSRKPSFVPVASPVASVTTDTQSRRASVVAAQKNWQIETDSLNMLMNQVLEQMETGPVSMNLVARIKNHPFYDSRPMVKELLESILAAQPASVQKQASKLIQQQSQELVRKQQPSAVGKRTELENDEAKQQKGKQIDGGTTVTATIGYQKPETSNKDSSKPQPRSIFEGRAWHSVEVGFDPDEDMENNNGHSSRRQSVRTDVTEETVQDTSFEDETEDELQFTKTEPIILKPKEEKSATPQVTTIEKTIRLGAPDSEQEEDEEEDENEEEEDEEEEEEDEEVEEEEEGEEYNTEIDELGKEVEQVEEDEDNNSFESAVSHLNSEQNPPPDPLTPSAASQFLEPFDRGLIKRQSKGKYQHAKVELYGRGVSTECESPTLVHRRIGGPQPTIERSPFLFDKAKKYIMTYPKYVDDSDDEGEKLENKNNDKKMNWLKTQDPDVPESSVENQIDAAATAASLDKFSSARSQPTATKSEDEEASESEEEEEEDEEEDEESEEEEEEEEEEDEGEEQQKTVELTRTDRKKLSDAKESYYAQPSVSVTDPLDVANANFTFPPTNPQPNTTKQSTIPREDQKPYVHVGELKLADKNDRKPTTIVPLNFGGNVAVTKSALERKAVDRDPKKYVPYSNAEPERALAKSPTPPSSTADKLEMQRGAGIQAWESAASYIRRRNRERRLRNRTIGTPEDVLRSVMEYRDYTSNANGGLTSEAAPSTEDISSPTATTRAPSPTLGATARTLVTTDPFYQHTRPTSVASTKDTASSILNGNVPGSLFNFVRPRYHDESYRRRDVENEPPLSPSRFNVENNQLTLSHSDKNKSRSAHDLTPDRPEAQTTYNAPWYGSSGTPHHYTSRYENEITPSHVTSTVQPENKRFHVYQTRAEREAERNAALSNLHQTPAYRAGSTWYTGTSSDRPLSSYTPGSYRSRFDDNFLYRRSAYDVERPTTPTPVTDAANANVSTTTTTTTSASQQPHDRGGGGGGGLLSRFRPVARRVASSVGDSERRNSRSQSMDRKATISEENDFLANVRNRLATPEISTDRTEYNYVNYHDTSSAAGSLPREPDQSRIPSRGILKNKQSADLEPRASATPVSENGRGLVGGKDRSPATSGVRNMLDRLKRRLSTEKSVSPAPPEPLAHIHTQHGSSGGPRHRFGLATGLANSPGGFQGSEISEFAMNNFDEARKNSLKAEETKTKKRSFLNLGRRKTAEISLNADGKIVTSGIDDDFKRPSSPIEKIKSFFRKAKEPPSTTTANASNASQASSAAFPSYRDRDYVPYSPAESQPSATNRYGLTDKVFGVYPSSNLSPVAARDSYVPQYRKYGAGPFGAGVANGNVSKNLNRYSYTPGFGSDRPVRHWYEDSHLY